MSLKVVEKSVHTLARVFAFISVVVLFLMMVFIGVDVVAGYAFRHPLPGNIDVITLMMIVLVFPVLAYTVCLDGQVRTDIMYEKLSKRGKGLCDIVNCGGAIFLVGLMTWRLGLRAWTDIQNPPGNITSYLEWPHLPFMILGTVCLALMTAEVIIQFVHAIDDAIHG
jgi:TRAP-type C4-dicarboxylate transport system permease small subunit